MNKIKILLVEDEEVLAMIVKETLEKFDFEISVALNGVEGWSRFNYDKPDICIIDVMLPRKDGLSLVSDIRKIDEQVPIIFLTARVRTEDVLKGLEAGADDYMKKPFSMEELILRIKSLLRRANLHLNIVTVDLPEEVTVGNYRLNYLRQELIHNQGTINLSQRETELLKLLLDHKNKLLDRHLALIKIWGEDSIFNSRSMDVYISRIRKYLVHDANVQIINVRGQGYKLID